MPHLSAQPFCLLPRFRPSTIQFNQAKLFSRASPVACTWLLLLLMLLLLLVAVVVVHVVAAYCHKTLRRAPLKDNCQTDMLPTHGLKGETERYRISLSTTPLVCSFCPTPSLFSPLLSLFTSLCSCVIFACFMSRAAVMNQKQFLTLHQIKVTTAAVVPDEWCEESPYWVMWKLTLLSECSHCLDR